MKEKIQRIFKKERSSGTEITDGCSKNNIIPISNGETDYSKVCNEPGLRTRSLRKRRGLTLIELSIVILVIGIIMTVVLVNLDFGVAEDARRTQVQSAATQLQTYWNRYEFSHGQIREGQDLTILADPTEAAAGWRTIDERLVQDPWGNPYFICRDNRGARQICSYGQDGQPGGEGPDSDFYLTDRSSWPDWLQGN